jgi:membrane dipeptidase
LDSHKQTISAKTRQIHDRWLVWDAHACFPLNPTADLSQLKRYKDSGVSFVSINIGMDMDTFEKVIQVLAGFRNYIKTRPEEYILAQSVANIRQARQTNRLAVAFDLEGSDPLAGNLNLVSFYYDLGVRQMLLAYNKDNRASGGCMEGKTGLTDFGRQVIREMNRVGMVVDASHIGYRATMETFETSTAPVIFSHSNPKGVREHARNITDEQIQACARTGGVVGINGIGDFLGGTRSETVVEHIEYVIRLVGPEHVGLGLDYVIDKQELLDYVAAYPERFPPDKMKDLLSFVEPEQFPEITGLLLDRGHSEAAVRGILGENFLRVAQQTWK